MTEQDQIFITSKQASQKLSIAITGYFYDKPEDADLMQQYHTFLCNRSFSVLQWILHNATPDILNQLLHTGWLSDAQLKRGLEEPNVSTDMRILLIRMLYPNISQISNKKSVSHSDVLTKLQLQLFQKFPHLRFAVSGFHFKETDETSSAGTDGAIYYYNKETLLHQPSYLERFYFHSVLHCLWLHLQIKTTYQPKLWNLSCDICVAYLGDCLLGSDPSPDGCTRRMIYETFQKDVDLSFAPSIYHYLEQQFSNNTTFSDFEALFQLDDHQFWYTQNGHGLHKWTHFKQSTGNLLSTPVKKHFGITPGSRIERIELRKEAIYDFHSYLQKFTITEEELQTNMDTFDYIFYLYGLEHYKNLPLIEPLEYTDADKVEELVIAIDTSGSCKEEIVQQFLAETCRILTDHRNFFRRMNVHILQCDSLIQEHVKISSIEEWNRYIANIKIVGRGGTDFTPVFTYTDQLIATGELRHLKGLLYFTDGDGIYPKQAPLYETAFVFTNKQFLNFPVPNWAVRLCLNLT